MLMGSNKASLGKRAIALRQDFSEAFQYIQRSRQKVFTPTDTAHFERRMIASKLSAAARELHPRFLQAKLHELFMSGAVLEWERRLGGEV